MRLSALLAAVLAGGLLAAMPASGAEVVEIGGGFFSGKGLLLRPERKPVGSVILMAGGHGRLGLTPGGEITSLGGNTLVRMRQRFASAGFATLVLDSGASTAAAVEYMRGVARPVTVVAMSKAGTRVADGLSARPDGLVLLSAMLDDFRRAASPSQLPPTLVVHHRDDTCRVTQPQIVEPFLAFAQGRARVTWMTGGVAQGDPCEARGHHGMAGIEGKMLSVVTQFARNPR